MRLGGWHAPELVKSADSLLKWSRDFSTQVGHFVQSLARVINGALTYGDGTEVDNIRGEWIEFTSSAVAGAENTVPHSLGIVPVGFHVMIPPAEGSVNKGPTPWTESNLYLKTSSASQTVKIFVLAPPESS